eukprot:1161765-Pelagomonas_calceolata.AAC.11
MLFMLNLTASWTSPAGMALSTLGCGAASSRMEASNQIATCVVHCWPIPYISAASRGRSKAMAVRSLRSEQAEMCRVSAGGQRRGAGISRSGALS